MLLSYFRPSLAGAGESPIAVADAVTWSHTRIRIHLRLAAVSAVVAAAARKPLGGGDSRQDLRHAHPQPFAAGECGRFVADAGTGTGETAASGPNERPFQQGPGGHSRPLEEMAQGGEAAAGGAAGPRLLLQSWY